MMKSSFRPLLETIAMAGTAFGIHFILLRLFWSSKKTLAWHYDLTTIYCFFVVCSLAIVLALIKVRQKNIDSVGNTFMLLTCIKAALAYVMLHPILQSGHREVGFEKINFFIVFAVFLAIETLVSIRLLQTK